MNKTQGQSDAIVTVLALVATVLGLLAVWDSGYARAAANGNLVPRELQSQLLFCAIAVFLGVFVSRVRPSVARKLSAWVLILTIVGMALVDVPGLGKEINGARRWLDFRFATLQPAEFVKLATIMFVGAMLAWWKPVRAIAVKNWGEALDRIWVPRIGRLLPGVLVVIAMLMVERQKDLGTMFVVGVAGFAVLLVAGVDKKALLAVFLVACAGGVFFIGKESYRGERIEKHIHRWSDDNIDGPGYQTTQSETALARGGLLGVGLGNGLAKQRLPAPTTDFVLATVGEEFGLLGSLFVIGVLGLLCWRLTWLAVNRDDVYGRSVLGGVAAWIAVQSVVNVLMVNGTLPPVGVPLPFISAGGSSLVALWAALGVCQSIICGEPVSAKEGADATDRDGWRHGRPRVSGA